MIAKRRQSWHRWVVVLSVLLALVGLAARAWVVKHQRVVEEEEAQLRAVVDLE